ncbi:MAG: AAA family ATPase [bacterium]
MTVQPIAELEARFADSGYIADSALLTTLVLMQQLGRPLLLEGEAGVGKTEVATTLATIEECKLIRLQCYEGLDTSAAVYEWNYSRQLLTIKLHESEPDREAPQIFSREFLLERPLLQSIMQDQPPILLIDEIDRADEAFEAYLLELLSEFQITIPELGTLKARSLPRVILTSNGTRELSDALRRRCLYHYLDYPDRQREITIVEKRVPGFNHKLATQVVDFIQNLRQQNLAKSPGIAETLDWCAALQGLRVSDLGDNIDSLYQTRGCFLKTRDDIESVDRDCMTELLKKSA